MYWAMVQWTAFRTPNPVTRVRILVQSNIFLCFPVELLYIYSQQYIILLNNSVSTGRPGIWIQRREFESWYSQQYFFSVELFSIYSQQYISLLHNSVCTFYWYKVSFGNWKMGKIIKSFLKDKLKRNSKFGHAQYMRII